MTPSNEKKKEKTMIRRVFLKFAAVAAAGQVTDLQRQEKQRDEACGHKQSY